MSRLGRDYLQVGMYTDVVFPDNDVRFIAIKDNVDSDTRSQNYDFTAILNLFNEFHARDTAKKVRDAMALRGNSGKYLCTVPPYGYLRDPQDKERKLVCSPDCSTARIAWRKCTSAPVIASLRIRITTSVPDTRTLWGAAQHTLSGRKY